MWAVNVIKSAFNSHILLLYSKPSLKMSKDGHNKGQKWNGMDVTEAEDIKNRWQEYTEELYKKDHDPDNHDGVITHLEPDILECEVK